MIPPYGILTPYLPGATPPPSASSPATLSDAVKAAAKEAGASHISADGGKIYKQLFGEWLQATFDGREGEAWWPCPEPCPELVEGGLPAGAVEV